MDSIQQKSFWTTPESSSKPELRPKEHQRKAHEHEHPDAGVEEVKVDLAKDAQAHDLEPARASLERAHLCPRRLHAPLRLVHALARAAHHLLVRLERAREALRARLEGPGHLEDRLRERVLLGALAVQQRLCCGCRGLRRGGLAAVGEEGGARGGMR